MQCTYYATLYNIAHSHVICWVCFGIDRRRIRFVLVSYTFYVLGFTVFAAAAGSDVGILSNLGKFGLLSRGGKEVVSY